jgi:hypothetical protein
VSSFTNWCDSKDEDKKQIILTKINLPQRCGSPQGQPQAGQFGT